MSKISHTDQHNPTIADLRSAVLAIHAVKVRAPQDLVTATGLAAGAWDPALATAGAWPAESWAVPPAAATPVAGQAAGSDLAALVAANPNVLNDPSVSAAVAAALGYTVGGPAAVATDEPATTRTRKNKTKDPTATDESDTATETMAPIGLGETTTGEDESKSKSTTSSGLPGSVTDTDEDDDDAAPTSSSSSSSGGYKLNAKFGWTAALLVTAGYFVSL